MDANTINRIESVIDGKIANATRGGQTQVQATVLSTDDDGTVWVKIPGGPDRTPVERSNAEVKGGDTVTVRIENGKAAIVGNATAPSIGAERASEIAAPAFRAASQAARDSGAAVKASVAARRIAEEAESISKATNQHFWERSEDPGDGADAGAFVTDVEKDEFLAQAALDFPDESDEHPYHNLLMNSKGILLRRTKKILVSISKSAIAFFDGLGNNAENIVARFGSAGAQIGKSAERHVEAAATKLGFYPANSSTDDSAYFFVGSAEEMTGESTTATRDILRLGKRSTTHLHATNTTIGYYPANANYYQAAGSEQSGLGVADDSIFMITSTPNVRIGRVTDPHIRLSASEFALSKPDSNATGITSTGNYMSMTASAFRLGEYAKPHLYMTDSSMGFYPASSHAADNAYFRADASEVRSGQASGYNTVVSSDGLLLKNNGAINFNAAQYQGSGYAGCQLTFGKKGAGELADGVWIDGHTLSGEKHLSITARDSSSSKAADINLIAYDSLRTGNVKIGKSSIVSQVTDASASSYTRQTLNNTSIKMETNGGAWELKKDGSTTLPKPLAMGQGGTGQTGVTTVTDISEICTASSGVNITSASYSTWGKVAQVNIVFTLDADLAGNAVKSPVCNIVSGKRPKKLAGGCTAYMVSNLNTNGNVICRNASNSTLTAGTQREVSFTYLLP